MSTLKEFDRFRDIVFMFVYSCDSYKGIKG